MWGIDPSGASDSGAKLEELGGWASEFNASPAAGVLFLPSGRYRISQNVNIYKSIHAEPGTVFVIGECAAQPAGSERNAVPPAEEEPKDAQRG